MRLTNRLLEQAFYEDGKRETGKQEADRIQSARLDRIRNNKYADQPGHGNEDKAIQNLTQVWLSAAQRVDERSGDEREHAKDERHDR